MGLYQKIIYISTKILPKLLLLLSLTPLKLPYVAQIKLAKRVALKKQ